ncbi:MAG: anhydro-N-acetylmuramic acid kinase [Methylomicrobium sp.]
MSGTSIDGIDAVLVDLSSDNLKIIAFEYQPFYESTKAVLAEITSSSRPILLESIGKMDTQLGQLFAETALRLLANTKIPASEICAIGSHGHTLYHAPSDRYPFCLQIGDPNTIAQLTGITTVADFRRRDIAAGGQGAPLVPAFHEAMFRSDAENRVIVNIGGIANITVLPKDRNKPVVGFDTGPGNTLMDAWINQHLGKNHDDKGTWARFGRLDETVLQHLKRDSYFSLPYPKSTGREYFSLTWLNERIGDIQKHKPEDIQTCLCQLTADTITYAIRESLPDTNRLLVCGGGARNDYLMESLQNNLHCPVQSTEEYGLHPDYVEATAFAWLARQTIHRLPGNLVTVTGARYPVILGGIYPAGN